MPVQAIRQVQEPSQGQARIGVGHQAEGPVDVHHPVPDPDPDQGMGEGLGHGPADVADIRSVIGPVALEGDPALLQDQQGIGATEHRPCARHRLPPGPFHQILAAAEGGDGQVGGVRDGPAGAPEGRSGQRRRAYGKIPSLHR